MGTKPGTAGNVRGYVQANAGQLPLREPSLDCVVCIRFMTNGKLGLGRAPLSRVSRRELEQEFRDAGFAIRDVVRASTPLLFDKWVVLAEKASRRRASVGAAAATGLAPKSLSLETFSSRTRPQCGTWS